MKKAYLFLLLLFIPFTWVCADTPVEGGQDTTQVDLLTKQGFKSRLNDYEETIKKAKQALELAQKLNYNKGIGESYRVLGLGEAYANHEAKAISNYLNALVYFKKAGDLLGQASVYNNIGNLYLTIDYDQALDYLQKGLKISQQLHDKSGIAKAYLNIGNVYMSKKNFSQSLDYYNKSRVLYDELKNDPVNYIFTLQNSGVIYDRLKQYDQAEKLLLQAHAMAKTQDMNNAIAVIDVTLTSIYIKIHKYDEARKFLDEGIAYAQETKDDKMEADFTYWAYQLEYHKKNYEKALNYMQTIYVRDSTIQVNMLATGLSQMKEQHDQQEKQKESELIIERQKNDRVKFWWAVSASGLLLIVIGLLFGNVKRKAKTNARLTELNSEVSRQKDNLDRINHHLEEIIDERTRDLQIKNKKLSEYSSYLSHQIRGPIATLKGLMNLEKEGLVDQQECINMMNKCVSDIDEKIIDMTDTLHDPKRTGF